MAFFSSINYYSGYLIELILTSLLLYVVKFYFDYFTRPNKLPGPIPLPILGTLLWYNGNSTEWVTKLHDKYGDMCELYMGRERYVWISNGDHVSKVVSPSSNNNFLIRIIPNQGLAEIGFTTKGLTFNRDLESWKFNRKFFSQAIATPKFLKQTTEKIQELFFEMEMCWSKLSDINFSDINLSEWISQLMADLMFLVTTNKRAYTVKSYYHILIEKNEIETEKEEGKEKGKGREKGIGGEGIEHFKDAAIKEIKEAGNFIKIIHNWLCALQFFMDTPKLWRDYIPSYKRKVDYFKKNIDKAKEVYLKLIRDRKQEIDGTPMDEQLNADMLTMLLTINTPRDITTRIADDKRMRPLSEEEILGNIFEVISAGVDTVRLS